MPDPYDLLYEHIVRLEGDVRLFQATEYPLGTLLLVFQGKGLTRSQGWFHRRERYYLLSTPNDLQQMAYNLARDLQNDLSVLPSAPNLVSTNRPFVRNRPAKIFLVAASCIEYDLQGMDHPYSGPALIVEVEHDDATQHRIPRPVIENEPYPFLCHQDQLLKLAEDIAYELHPLSDDRVSNTE